MSKVDVSEILNLGIALSEEKDSEVLFQNILNEAIKLTDSDAGTIYILKDNALYFNYVITKSKNICINTDNDCESFPPVPLGRKHVCACCALDKKMINIDDIYENQTYDFSGAQKYDALNDYRTRSMLVVPMLDETGDCIGVLQLINAGGDGSKRYDAEDEQVICALASFVAISLNNRNMSDEIQRLLHSFVSVMVGAIDTRTPYNASHTKSMVMYGEKFIDWLRDSNRLIFSEKEKDPFLMSIWLHDIGKLLIPLEIMDKKNRLGKDTEKVLNRITIAILMEKISGDYAKIKELENARDLILKADEIGFLSDELFDELKTVFDSKCLNENGDVISLLTDDEIEKLSVRKGTLTEKERHIMESHVEYTYKMLSIMDFSGRYKNVVNMASMHHEQLDNSGYPNKIGGEDIPTQTRIITILDIYDALTADDRPYKPSMSPQKAFSILDDMASKGKIDKGILELFKESRAWEK